MSQRVPFPADVCPEPDAKFHRVAAEAFPCGPREAVALQKFEQPPVWRWLLAALAVLVAGVMLSGCDAQAAPEQPLTKAELGAAKACGKGYTAAWVDAVTHECLREMR